MSVNLIDTVESFGIPAVVVKVSVSKTPVKKHIKETGEMVPGVTITERPEKFSVEVV